MTTVQQVIDNNLVIRLANADSQLLSEIQRDLNILNYYTLSIDGIYGQGTFKAWTAFKKAYYQGNLDFVGAGSLAALQKAVSSHFQLSPQISSLNLMADVALKAQQLFNLNNNTVFTSGRRDKKQQAHAMATNIVENSQYIVETYASSPASTELQQWVDNNPSSDVETIANGLYSVMATMTPDVISRLSKHLSGRAFDLQPHSCTYDEANSLNPDLFLTTEAGLTIWHLQWN